MKGFLVVKDVRHEHLDFREAIFLLAHGSCENDKIDSQYLTWEERRYAENFAEIKLIKKLKEAKLTATGLRSDKKRTPIKEKWQSQQWSTPILESRI